MTRIVPIRPDVHLRELMCGKHERPSMPREMRIELAVLKVAERCARNTPKAAHWFLQEWLYGSPQTLPINSIRSAYRSLS